MPLKPMLFGKHIDVAKLRFPLLASMQLLIANAADPSALARQISAEQFRPKEFNDKKEACTLLGISLRTLERRIKAGTYQRLPGRRATFTHAALGLPEPSSEPIEPALPSALPVAQATVEDEAAPVRMPEPDGGPSIVSLDEMATEDLQAALIEWRKPSDPRNGVPTNAPSLGSSSMPSPLNYARFIRANAILQERRFSGFTPTRTTRPQRAFNAPSTLGTGVYAYRPATGYGLTEEDLSAESLTLKNHPNFARNRYTR